MYTRRLRLDKDLMKKLLPEQLEAYKKGMRFAELQLQKFREQNRIQNGVVTREQHKRRRVKTSCCLKEITDLLLMRAYTRAYQDNSQPVCPYCQRLLKANKK